MIKCSNSQVFQRNVHSMCPCLPACCVLQVVVVDPVTGQPQTIMVPADQLGALGTVQAGPAQPAIIAPGGAVTIPGQPEGIILQQQPIPIAAAPPPMQQQTVQQPPPQQMQQQAPPPQQQQQAGGGVGAAGGLFAGQDPAQMQTLLRQVMGMTDEQINGLPEQFKQQVLYVKEQIRSGHVRLE
jgi:hypothetical protein